MDVKACAFCGKSVNLDDPKIYNEITAWVHGEKSDGATLREKTGRFAHDECVQLVKAGQAPDQPMLFEDEDL